MMRPYRSRSARLLASTAIVIAIGAATAGCQTTQVADSTNSISLAPDQRSDAELRRDVVVYGTQYRTNPGDVNVALRYAQALRGSGHLLSVASLGSSRKSVSITPRDGKPVIRDGPFAEAKEVLGSFFLIEAKDMDEAVRVASLHPAARLGETVGWGVEVRAIDFYDAPSGA